VYGNRKHCYSIRVRYSDVERELLDGFVAALEHVGLSPEVLEEADLPDCGVDFVLLDTATGVRFVVECKAVATSDAVRQLDSYESDAYKVLVSRRVSADVRGQLSRLGMGFYDGRGHLRLRVPPLVVDTTVPGLSPGVERQRRLRIDSGALLDVSLAALMGITADGVRATAKEIRRAPGTVSKNLAALREARLVDDDNVAVVPDLFAAVAEEWRPMRVPVRDMPQPGSGKINSRLELGFEAERADVGWVLADQHAAAAWGAPVVIDSNYPPDFYVPSSQVAANARALLGTSEFGRHACTVAVAPSPLVCRYRVGLGRPLNTEWPAPAAVVAALDLFADPGRGREILNDWIPDGEDFVRVW